MKYQEQAKRAIEDISEGKGPLACVRDSKYGCCIINGVQVYLKNGDVPVPAGLWMDQPEDEWKGLGLSKKERATRECLYQLDNYVSKQYWYLKKEWQGSLTKEDIQRAIKEGVFPS